MKKKTVISLAAAGVLVLTIGGCSMDKATEQFKDAPVSSHDDSAATVLNFPDGFSNVATKCDGPNRVYVVFHGDSAYGAVSVVPNDPRCTEN